MSVVHLLLLLSLPAPTVWYLDITVLQPNTLHANMLMRAFRSGLDRILLGLGLSGLNFSGPIKVLIQ